MELITFSNFEKIANTFTVNDVADSNNLNYYEADTVVDTHEIDSKGGGEVPIINIWICLVKENGKVIGYYTHKTGDQDLIIDEEGSILNKWQDIMEPISPNNLVSGDTPIIDLLTLFDDPEDFYLVLNKNAITHSICYYDLDCNEVKISIFALIMELDNILNELILKIKIPIESKLSPERIHKINELRSLDRYKQHKSYVYYTNFRDKVKILNDALDFGFIDKDVQKKFVEKLSLVRNKIAHGESIIGYRFFEVDPTEDQEGKTYIVGNLVEEKILFEPKDMKVFIQQLRILINNAKSKLLLD